MNGLARGAVVAAWLSVQSAVAADPAAYTRGLELYQNHCTGCHQSVVHVREARTVADRGALAAQVRRRARALDLDWGEAEVHDVVHYLGRRFYGFEAPESTI